MRYNENERALIKDHLIDRAKNAAVVGNDSAKDLFLDAANIIRDLEAEVARLDKLAHLRIPRIFRKD
jgi:hypothetical protein